MKPRWLDRRIAAPGPFLTLCLSEGDFEAVLRHCKINERPPFVKNAWSSATLNWFESDGNLVCAVCIRGFEGRNPVEVAGLLVHEAVHIWQAYSTRIGESEPGDEQEAYAIQSIAQELMAEFARRMG